MFCPHRYRLVPYRAVMYVISYMTNPVYKIMRGAGESVGDGMAGPES